MSSSKILRLVMAALFAAACCVATAFLKIPGPLGYYHLGDGFCMLAGLLLGPVWGGLAAGIGSALADVITGCAIYAIPTLLIKAAVAAACWQLAKKLPVPAAAFCAGLPIPLLYGLFEWAVYGAGFLAAVPGSVIQMVVGVIVAAVIYPAASRIMKGRKP